MIRVILLGLGGLLAAGGFWTGVVFMVLRLAGATQWSWWAVTAPLWAVPVGVVLSVVAAVSITLSHDLPASLRGRV